MKKSILALLICCGLILCACGKSEAVKNVEELISGIGVISFDSAEAIQNAQDAYDALTNDDKKKVENYQVLQDAHKAYDDLGIQITLDNYQKYLDVSVVSNMTDGIDFGLYAGTGRTIGTYVYRGIESTVSVSGKSNNYDYNDITVTVAFSGYYVPIFGTAPNIDEEYFEKNTTYFDYELTAITDIIGNGYAENTIDMPDGSYLLSGGTNVSIGYEIVDVSGTMTPIK